MPVIHNPPGKEMLIGVRGKPRPSDLVAQQPLGEGGELGRGRIDSADAESFQVFGVLKIEDDAVR